ncbi:hypothetical protein [Allosphingosinicella vermicomposti]|uniref:hypothetical protein n=1 Tax=Allosphingosinicella vermicomposti TaxID=614671 RepID=UPI000D0F6AEB|nr:hypothetical protein [Allosphingosinicella vermicomposti]
MTDIGELHVEWLVPYVRKTRDFEPLAAFIKGGGAVTDELRSLVADILTGLVKPSRKGKARTSAKWPGMLKREVAFWSDEFRFHAGIPKDSQRGLPPAYDDWQILERILAASGYRGAPDTKGQCTVAAKKVVCWHHRLTPSQLDELLHPRATRPRKAF